MAQSPRIRPTRAKLLQALDLEAAYVGIDIGRELAVRLARCCHRVGRASVGQTSAPPAWGRLPCVDVGTYHPRHG